MKMMTQRWIACVLVSFVTAPAFADVRATYLRGDDQSEKLIIEVSDQGAMRAVIQPGWSDDYFLFLENGNYTVTAGPGGPDVTTIEAATELARRRRKDVIEFGGSSQKPDRTGLVTYLPVGTATISDNEGIVYNLPGAAYPESTKVVLSTDPALLPLGKAITAYKQAITGISVYADDETPDNLAELLSEHGVLSIWEYELMSINFAPIDAFRFTVPAKPLMLADLPSEEPEVKATAEGEPIKREPFVTHAAYHQNALYTLMSDDRLLAWPKGGDSGKSVELPATISDFCALGDDLILAAADPESINVRMWIGKPGVWSKVMDFTADDDNPVIALDCTGSEPLLLSPDAYRVPSESEPIPILSGTFHYYANLATLQHGGYLYLGTNAGEWGGGLQRFALESGKGYQVDRSDPNNTCGGMLNKDCDPVTGLAVDPRRPECILATTGLVHFSASGSVVRICGDSVSLAYAKPYTLDPNWQFDPDKAATKNGSVAFYSLGGNANGVWAVAVDGTYKFGDLDLPEHTPFSRVSNFPESGVDWSHPEYVLVRTTMNQHHSLSGASLILVPR